MQALHEKNNERIFNFLKLILETRKHVSQELRVKMTKCQIISFGDNL